MKRAPLTPQAQKIIKDLTYLRTTSQKYADNGGLHTDAYTSGGKTYEAKSISRESFLTKVEQYSCLIACVERWGAGFFDMPNRLKLMNDVYEERKRQR